MYELVLGNCPMKVFVRELSDDEQAPKTYLETNIHFTISVQGGPVVEASAAPGQSIELKEGTTAKVLFSHAVDWKEIGSDPIIVDEPFIWCDQCLTCKMCS